MALNKDQEIKTEKITLYQYGNVYFPDNDYYNSDPLPIEWLELFEDHEVLQKLFDSNKEFENLQAKLISEQRENDPKYQAMLTRRQNYMISKYSKTEDETKKMRKSISQESPFVNTSLHSNESKNLTSTAFKGTNNMDVSKLQDEMKSYLAMKDKIEKNDFDELKYIGQTRYISSIG